MEKLKLFQDTVCEVMNLANGKCLVRDCMGEVNEVYQYELQDIPLSKELLEHLGFRFKEADYKINGWECYMAAKINRVYLTPTFFIEEKKPTPQIGYVVMADSEERFSVSTRTYIDGRIGTRWVYNLNDFLYLCDRLGCHVDVDMRRLNAFVLRNKAN